MIRESDRVRLYAAMDAVKAADDDLSKVLAEQTLTPESRAKLDGLQSAIGDLQSALDAVRAQIRGRLLSDSSSGLGVTFGGGEG